MLSNITHLLKTNGGKRRSLRKGSKSRKSKNVKRVNKKSRKSRRSKKIKGGGEVTCTNLHD